jgi:ribosomal protein L40E
MRRTGSQYVCRKCGAWTDPGTSPARAKGGGH